MNILVLYINILQFRSFQMPSAKMLNLHGQQDGAKRLISFQKGGYPWPTAYNRNFTVNF